MTDYTYIHRTPDFAVEEDLAFGNFRLRVFPRSEAEQLRALLARRHAFSRHATNVDGYAKRACELAEQVVLYRTKFSPATSVDAVRQKAMLTESLITISRCFAERRETLQKSMCAVASVHSRADIWVAQRDQQVSRKSSKPHVSKPVKITRADASRFATLGFGDLIASLEGNAFLWNRARAVADWLLLSRLDPDPGSAFIKTGTSAESLIAGKERGKVTKRLSVRLALLTAGNAAEFESIRKLTVDMYDLRCDFTHGGTRSGVSSTKKRMLEAFDRLTALGLSSLAASGSHLSSPHDVDTWFKSMETATLNQRPFSGKRVKSVLALVGR